MKLLNIKQVIDNKENQISRSLSRISELDKLILSKQKEVNKLEEEFNITLNRQKESWLKEKNTYINKIKELIEEAGLLEKRKEQALLPITERDNNSKKILKLAVEKEKKLNDKEIELDEKLDLLEDKITSLSDRELKIKEKEQLQYIAQEGIELQKEQIKQDLDNLNKLIIKKNEEFNSKFLELSKKIAEIELRENTIKDKEMELIKIENSFADREKAIKDKYETLQRTINKTKNYAKSKL